jgi:hypothetical protein
MELIFFLILNIALLIGIISLFYGAKTDTLGEIDVAGLLLIVFGIFIAYLTSIAINTSLLLEQFQYYISISTINQCGSESLKDVFLLNMQDRYITNQIAAHSSKILGYIISVGSVFLGLLLIIGKRLGIISE